MEDGERGRNGLSSDVFLVGWIGNFCETYSIAATLANTSCFVGLVIEFSNSFDIGKDSLAIGAKVVCSSTRLGSDM